MAHRPWLTPKRLYSCGPQTLQLSFPTEALLEAGSQPTEKPFEGAGAVVLAGPAGPALRKAMAEPPSRGQPAVALPDGAAAPVSMFSARFDGGDLEKKFRRVHELLVAHRFRCRMVSAAGSDDFGEKTLEYLGELREEKGVMIAVCTPHYGEKTKSPYSSNAELRFALDEGIRVLPLKVSDTYPPEPPGGPEHPFDKENRAKTLCRMVFKGSVVFLDCREKAVEEIAVMIANQLVRMS